MPELDIAMYFTSLASLIHQEQLAIIYYLSICQILYYLVANSDFLTSFCTNRIAAGAQRDGCCERSVQIVIFNHSAGAQVSRIKTNGGET
jgi:hypothetical protein